MFIIPEWNMVVVRLGLDQRQLKITDRIYADFIARIGQAVDP